MNSSENPSAGCFLLFIFVFAPYAVADRLNISLWLIAFLQLLLAGIALYLHTEQKPSTTIIAPENSNTASQSQRTESLPFVGYAEEEIYTIVGLLSGKVVATQYSWDLHLLRRPSNRKYNAGTGKLKREDVLDLINKLTSARIALRENLGTETLLEHIRYLNPRVVLKTSNSTTELEIWTGSTTFEFPDRLFNNSEIDLFISRLSYIVSKGDQMTNSLADKAKNIATHKSIICCATFV